MKHFFLKLLFFLFPFFIISYLLDIMISHEFKKSNGFSGEFEVWNDIYDGKLDCDIAIYGSSRAWVQFDPAILSDSLHKKVYNFGIDGHNFWLQYLRHKEYLNHDKKPETIILSVDINTLQKRKDLYNLEQFLPYMLWNLNIMNYTSSYIGFNKIDYFIPLTRYFGKKTALNSILDNLGENKTKRFRTNGYQGRDESWNFDFERAKTLRKEYYIELDIPTIQKFEEFLIECKQLSCNIILVYSPEYFEGQQYAINRQNVINIFRYNAEKYNLSFMDFSENEITSQRDFFYNSTHLNKNGAEVFTSLLAHDLLYTKK